LISIEGNWYFPPNRVRTEYLQSSPTPYTCPWKGVCQYWTLEAGADRSPDTAWSYPHPIPDSIPKVGRDYSGFIAFWKEARVTP
jgi:uncharacterized protein (DUF427 family)